MTCVDYFSVLGLLGICSVCGWQIYKPCLHDACYVEVVFDGKQTMGNLHGVNTNYNYTQCSIGAEKNCIELNMNSTLLKTIAATHNCLLKTAVQYLNRCHAASKTINEYLELGRSESVKTQCAIYIKYDRVSRLLLVAVLCQIIVLCAMVLLKAILKVYICTSDQQKKCRKMVLDGCTGDFESAKLNVSKNKKNMYHVSKATLCCLFLTYILTWIGLVVVCGYCIAMFTCTQLTGILLAIWLCFTAFSSTYNGVSITQKNRRSHENDRIVNRLLPVSTNRHRSVNACCLLVCVSFVIAAGYVTYKIYFLA